MTSKRHRDGWGEGALRSAWIGAVRRFASLAAVVAILAQALLVQTHIHTFAEFGAPAAIERVGLTAASVSDRVVLSAPDQSRHAAVCALCQAQATTGGATLSSGPVLSPPFDAHGHMAPLRLAAFVRRASHDWRSRAPPTTLTT